MIDTQNAMPTGGFPVVSLVKRDRHLHAWISDGTRLPGRHRAGRPGLVHVTGIAGLPLARAERVSVGAMARPEAAPSLLARLMGGAW